LLNSKGRMARTFVIGDIHGAYRALRQCLERASFDREKDTLICLGDVADGWPETQLCIDDLLKIHNLIYVLGNHDYWTLEWMETGVIEEIWYHQGGKATIESYPDAIPQRHVHLLKTALPYYLHNNRLFVHAGIDPSRALENNGLDIFLWDRKLARTALDFYQKGIAGKLTNFDEIYLGHTPVPYGTPIQSCEIWLMDTGAGWAGTLSMMDIETKETFISDAVPSLYPGVAGRVRK
jgi:serine/threonine protein phosphatase 1